MQRLMPRPSTVRSLLAGLAAGGAAAIVAVFVSQQLPSPDRAWLNPASIGVIAVVAGALSGLLYALAGGQRRPLALFGGVLAGVFVLVALAALLVEALPSHPISGVAAYCIPLAALSLALLGVLTPLWARVDQRLLASAPVLAVAGLAVAFFVNARTAPSGHLALPQAAQASAPGAASADGLVRLADVKGLAFVVDPSQSKATYSVHERLTRLPAPDDAVGSTNQVSGTIYLDGRPSTVNVDMGSFKSDDRGRDSHLLRDPGLGSMAPAQFTVTQLDLPSTYKPGDTVTRNVQGMLTINNVQKPVTRTTPSSFTGRRRSRSRTSTSRSPRIRKSSASTTPSTPKCSWSPRPSPDPPSRDWEGVGGGPVV
jgi:polyisoprenoid-binding protein YceI